MQGSALGKAVISVGALLLFADLDEPPAMAAANCEQYARDAVAANAQNISLGCRFGESRWSSNYNGHFQWCVGARQSSVDSEAGARAADLGRCRECTQYARMAVAANQTNLAKACRFVGPQWSSDYGGHYNWCWNLKTRGALGSETGNRDNQLRQCAAAAGRRTECDQYARTAISQFGAYRQKNCGPLTGRWGDNYQNHYGWCVAVTSADAQRETAARNTELMRCGATQPPGGTTPPGGQQPFCAASCDQCTAAKMRCQSAITGACPPTFEQTQRNYQCY